MNKYILHGLSYRPWGHLSDTGSEHLGALDVDKPSTFTGTGIAPLQSLASPSVPAWTLPEPTTACKLCGVLRLSQGPALSWDRGTRAGTSQGQPEELGAAVSPRAQSGTADFHHGSSKAGAEPVGKPPGASIRGCEQI